MNLFSVLLKISGSKGVILSNDFKPSTRHRICVVVNGSRTTKKVNSRIIHFTPEEYGSFHPVPESEICFEWTCWQKRVLWLVCFLSVFSFTPFPGVFEGLCYLGSYVRRGHVERDIVCFKPGVHPPPVSPVPIPSVRLTRWPRRSPTDRDNFEGAVQGSLL